MLMMILLIVKIHIKSNSTNFFKKSSLFIFYYILNQKNKGILRYLIRRTYCLSAQDFSPIPHKCDRIHMRKHMQLLKCMLLRSLIV